MHAVIRPLFERYELFFNRALAGEADLSEVEALYAQEFIAASPAGVMAGKNDDRLKSLMAEGFERYRAMGTKAMRLGDVSLSPIDEAHCVAHVAWMATYRRDGRPNVTIDFVVHYLVQLLNGAPTIFGWVSGDEQALLKEHGVI